MDSWSISDVPVDRHSGPLPGLRGRVTVAVEDARMTVVGRGAVEGYLSPEEVARLLADGLAREPLDGRRVLVLIPDGTRTMPMPLVFDILERELGPRVAVL